MSTDHFSVPSGNADEIIAAGQRICSFAGTADHQGNQLRTAVDATVSGGHWSSDASADFTMYATGTYPRFTACAGALTRWGTALQDYGYALKNAQQGLPRLNADASQQSAILKSPNPHVQGSYYQSAQGLLGSDKGQATKLTDDLNRAAAHLARECNIALQQLTAACPDASTDSSKPPETTQQLLGQAQAAAWAWAAERAFNEAQAPAPAGTVANPNQAAAQLRDLVANIINGPQLNTNDIHRINETITADQALANKTNDPQLTTWIDAVRAAIATKLAGENSNISVQG